ncbi:MAG TPA: YceI family protein [Gaiellaceae bacterium]|nr:YceI family protein [Gaiellaceae bacterium]
MRTGRGGAAAKAGHDLLLHVTAWEATLDVGDGSTPSSLTLDADAASLRVLQGTGGMQPLGDDDKASIEQTIDDEILMKAEISFRSTSVEPAADGGGLHVQGELTLAGETRPLAFDVLVGENGRLSGKAVVKQTDWGMKPYSALFGALKVADEVEVEVDASEERATTESVEAAPVARGPILDPGVSSFLWALLFFLYLLLGMAAIGIATGMAFILAALAGCVVFLFVRTHGIGRRGDEED